MLKRARSAKSIVVFFLMVALISTVAGVVLAQSSVYHGNTKSKIFHKPSCRYYNCKKCTAQFSSIQEAIDTGYRACKVCKP